MTRRMVQPGVGAGATRPTDRGTALVLVRNTVTHDARVLREAAALRELGFDVLVAGVVSTIEREPRVRIAGTDVVRLDPAAGIRRLVAAIRPRGRSRAPADPAPPAHPEPREPATHVPPRPAQTAGARAALRSRLKRLALTSAYYAQAVALARVTSPVLVHANDYNTMWAGIAVKALCRSRLIYDCHELWPDRNGRPEWRPWLIACEALFVRVADATITTSPGYAEAIGKRYRVRRPVLVRNIPAAGEPLPPVAGRSLPDNGALAVYVGGLMPGRGLEQAIQAIALAPGARLRLIGPCSASYRESLARCAEAAGVADRVELAPAVAPESVPGAIASADVGLMLIQPVCRSYELTLPNKLFEYAAAGVPILSSNLSVIGPLVREQGLGAVVAPADVVQIAAEIRRLAQPAVNRELRERVRAFGARETWEREQGKLQRVYLDLVTDDDR